MYLTSQGFIITGSRDNTAIVWEKVGDNPDTPAAQRLFLRKILCHIFLKFLPYFKSLLFKDIFLSDKYHVSSRWVIKRKLTGHTNFVNAVAALPGTPDFPAGLIVTGGQDTRILVHSMGKQPFYCVPKLNNSNKRLIYCLFLNILHLNSKLLNSSLPFSSR